MVVFDAALGGSDHSLSHTDLKRTAVVLLYPGVASWLSHWEKFLPWYDNVIVGDKA